MVEVTLPSGAKHQRPCDWLEPDLCSAHNLTSNETLVSGPHRDHRVDRTPTDARLYNKFIVTHKDGIPVGDNERYFVLAPDRDDPSKIALRAYVWAVSDTNGDLAASIVDAYGIDGFVFARARAVESRIDGASLWALPDGIDRTGEYTALRAAELREMDRALDIALDWQTRHRRLSDAVRAFLAIDTDAIMGDNSMAFYDERLKAMRDLVGDGS